MNPSWVHSGRLASTCCGNSVLLCYSELKLGSQDHVKNSVSLDGVRLRRRPVPAPHVIKHAFLPPDAVDSEQERAQSFCFRYRASRVCNQTDVARDAQRVCDAEHVAFNERPIPADSDTLTCCSSSNPYRRTARVSKSRRAAGGRHMMCPPQCGELCCRQHCGRQSQHVCLSGKSQTWHLFPVHGSHLLAPSQVGLSACHSSCSSRACVSVNRAIAPLERASQNCEPQGQCQGYSQRPCRLLARHGC